MAVKRDKSPSSVCHRCSLHLSPEMSLKQTCCIFVDLESKVPLFPWECRGPMAIGFDLLGLI